MDLIKSYTRIIRIISKSISALISYIMTKSLRYRSTILKVRYVVCILFINLFFLLYIFGNVHLTSTQSTSKLQTRNVSDVFRKIAESSYLDKLLNMNKQPTSSCQKCRYSNVSHILSRKLNDSRQLRKFSFDDSGKIFF